MNFILTNHKLKGYCQQLEKKQKGLTVSKELSKEDDSMIKQLKKYSDDIEGIIKANNITNLPYDKIIPPGYSGSISADQALSLTYWRANSYVTRKTHVAGDGYSGIRELRYLTDELMLKIGKTPELEKIYKDCHKLVENYDNKLKTKSRLEAFLRHDAYKSLLEVWDYFYNGENWKSNLNFIIMYGSCLDSNSSSALKTEDAQKINRAKDEYLSSLHKMHNYLSDKYDETNIVFDILSPAIKSFATTLVGLILIGVLLAALNLLNFKLPIKLINAAMKYIALVKQ